MDINLDLWLPVPPSVMGVVLACLVAYVLYRLAKLIISVYTGAS